MVAGRHKAVVFAIDDGIVMVGNENEITMGKKCCNFNGDEDGNRKRKRQNDNTDKTKKDGKHSKKLSKRPAGLAIYTSGFVS